MKLSSFCQGRDNNLNLLRIMAALAVLLTHSFSLSTGAAQTEPLRHSLGISLGEIAVDIFFIISGFLVTASLLSKHNLIDYVWGRILRIYPGLLVMIFLSVFLLGPLVTNLAPSIYFSDHLTYHYLIQCSTLLGGISYHLPGVFHSNPFPDVVNGSLWTMPYEIKMYGILAGLWLAVKTIPFKNNFLFNFSVFLLTLVFILGFTINQLNPFTQGELLRLGSFFFIGVSFQILKNKITLSTPIFLVLCLLLLSSSLISTQPAAFLITYHLVLAYLVMYITYIPAGWLRKYNRYGDYSYGVYIYAFPIQQLIVYLEPSIPMWGLFMASTLLTLGFAFISWHTIEKRALQFKPQFVKQTSVWLNKLFSKKPIHHY